MARDEKARSVKEEASLLDRRKYLKLAGATAATVTTFSASGAAASPDYETITVGAGETFTKTLSDGETWENKLIDVTADNAAYEIDAFADNWTIRNIGIKGQYPNRDDGSSNALWVRTNSADATGTIDNVYLGDGAVGTSYSDSGSSKCVGIFVDRNHAGHIDIKNVNVSQFPNNGIYGSAPGNPDSHPRPGAGGTVTIDTAYSEGCSVSGFRLGTEGSSFNNCVVKDARTRSFWAYYQNIDAENCDAVASDDAHYCVNDGTTLNVTDCRMSADTPNWGKIAGGGTINGTIGSDPRTSPPEGVPTTPEEAARGRTDDGSSKDSTTGSVLELVSNDDESYLTYEFTVDGSVQKRTDGANPADDNDSVTDNGDGTMTVSGWAGNGNGDSYLVDGTFTAMSLDESQWTIRYDGSEVSVADLTGALTKTIVIDGSLAPRKKSSYSFTVSGDVEKNADRGSINSSDSISGNEASGAVWGGIDAFDFSGEITSIDIDGPVTVTVEGVSSPTSDAPLLNTVVVDGSKHKKSTTDYTITVSGSAEKSSSLGSINSSDTISDGEISGNVLGGKDGYTFSGGITGFTLDGSARLHAEDGQ